MPSWWGEMVDSTSRGFGSAQTTPHWSDLAALALLAGETLFLVVTGAALWSSTGQTVLSPSEHYA